MEVEARVLWDPAGGPGGVGCAVQDSGVRPDSASRPEGVERSGAGGTKEGQARVRTGMTRADSEVMGGAQEGTCHRRKPGPPQAGRRQRQGRADPRSMADTAPVRWATRPPGHPRRTAHPPPAAEGGRPLLLCRRGLMNSDPADRGSAGRPCWRTPRWRRGRHVALGEVAGDPAAPSHAPHGETPRPQRGLRLVAPRLPGSP